jgi:hypothetical protein
MQINFGPPGLHTDLDFHAALIRKRKPGSLPEIGNFGKKCIFISFGLKVE